MSMSLVLEIEQGADIKDVEAALLNIEGSDVEWRESSLFAYISSSNLNVTVKHCVNQSILTEGSVDANWKVGLRIYFEIDATIINALSDVRRFIAKFSELSAFEFILSFQYENIYARKYADKLFIDENLMK